MPRQHHIEKMDEDEQDEGREMSESITKELRDCIFLIS